MSRSGQYMLMVEDSNYEIMLFESLVKDMDIPLQLEKLNCGEKVMDFLSGNLQSLPALILLDTHLSDLSGIEVLRRIKSSPQLCHLPVVIWSGVDYHVQKALAEHLGAVCYLVKPIELEELEICIRRIISFALPSG